MTVNTNSGSDHDFYKYPVLEIDGNIPEVSGQTTFQFVFAGNVEVTENVTGEGVLQGIINSATGSVLIESFDTALGDGSDIARRSFYIDVGAGETSISIDFLGWSGADNDLGTGTFYWGDVNGGEGNYTHESAKEQIQFFNRVVGGTITSSVSDPIIGTSKPARFYYGDYAPDNSGPNGGQGKFEEDFLPVAITSSNGVRSFENHETFDGSIELLAVQTLDIPIDSLAEEVGL